MRVAYVYMAMITRALNSYVNTPLRSREEH